MKQDDFIVYIAEHRWRILLIAMAIIILILLFTIGFWRTLLVVVAVAVCYIIGKVLDDGGKGGISAFFKALFGRKDD